MTGAGAAVGVAGTGGGDSMAGAGSTTTGADGAGGSLGFLLKKLNMKCGCLAVCKERAAGSMACDKQLQSSLHVVAHGCTCPVQFSILTEQSL
jgi:hypothetical protein